MKYQLVRSQQLNCNIATAWAFFSNPNNLANITPTDMNFKVLSKNSTSEIFEGMVIDYTVSPLLKIPLRWKTIITKVDTNRSFTDFQAKGPYKLWNHQHDFFENENGVLMVDTVDYELPFGILGKIAHAITVQKKVNAIFDYREKIIDQKFNQI